MPAGLTFSKVGLLLPLPSRRVLAIMPFSFPLAGKLTKETGDHRGPLFRFHFSDS